MHVRNHLALAAPAYGATARAIAELCWGHGKLAHLTLTKMADPNSEYETNEDMARLAQEIISDANIKTLFWNPAICDFAGVIDDMRSGKHATRLKTREGVRLMHLTPADKVVGSFKAARPDIFMVAFKTTTEASPKEMYAAGRKLRDDSGAELVLVNDTTTRRNLIVGPPEPQGQMYRVMDDRKQVLEALVSMTIFRWKVQP